MKVNKSRFMQHIGDFISIRDTDIPNGTYQIIESNNDKEILYNVLEYEVLTADLPNDVEFDIYEAPHQERLELLFEALSKIVFESMQDQTEGGVQAMNSWISKAEAVGRLLNGDEYE